MVNGGLGRDGLSLSSNDFELFGLAQQFDIDASALDHTWKQLQKQVHPDQFISQGAADKRLAMQWSVRVNEAYQRLKHPLKRAAYLCELHGAPIHAEHNTSMPSEFLIQQMQWREELEECIEAPQIEQLQNKVRQEKIILLQQCAHAIDNAFDYSLASQNVRALMFIERFEQDLDNRLEHLDNIS